MKEMLKSKAMIGFMVFLVSIVFMSAYETKKLEEKVDPTYNNVLSMNVK